MGTGIVAAIPLVFTPLERFNIDERYFTQGFFNNFNVEEIDGRKVYTIKKELLLNNYKSFLAEFYSLIEDDLSDNIVLDDIPEMDSLDEFSEVFSGNNRVPFIYKWPSMFSVLGCKCTYYWIFYNGSYKAYLEEYSTFTHFEKILAKTMKNPLGNTIKFGIFG
jgi:hypothetical protein